MIIILEKGEVITIGEQPNEECDLCAKIEECDKTWFDENGKLKSCIIPCG